MKLTLIRKLKSNFIIFLILFLSLFNLSYAENNISCVVDFENKIKKIRIKIDKNKNWTENNIKILISNTKIIPKKFKKRFSGEINIEYENNTSCKLKAKIRQNGDFRDHINYQDNKVSQSLDIKLLNGNLANVTNFKLLLDGTRGVSEDEILLSEILRALNYISPRTRFIDVEINGTKKKMLFQEKSRKELLEFNNRTESSIFEANENDLFKSLERFKNSELDIYEIGLIESSKRDSLGMFAKQLNSNWFSKGNIHSKISLKALSRLNLIYSNSVDFLKDDQGNKYYSDNISNITLGGLDKKNIIHLEKYNLILRLFNAEHALRAHNRQYYWNNSENYFEPIYYDGNPNIFEINATKIDFPISVYLQETINELNQDLNSLNLTKFKNNFFYKDNTFLDSNIEKKLSILKYNLSKIEENYKKSIQDGKEFEEVKKFEKKTLKKTMRYKSDRNKNAIFVFKKLNEEYTNDFLVCKDYENCDEVQLNSKEQADLVKGNLLKNSKEYIFIGEYPYEKINLDLKEYNNFKTKDNNINFYYDNGIQFDFDETNKKFLISQTKPESRAYFINSNIENFDIIFHGLDTNDNLKFFPIDTKGLTGCLVFYKSNFDNTNLKIQNSNCEDSLNLVRSKGKINKIEISNSYSDGLDIDFSNLYIEDIFIKNSKNDCVDVSAGTYEIANMQVSTCGDKGLSVGEKSILKLDDIFVQNSEIGIASKDGSKSYINNFKGKNIDICLSAYNKKQEFSGGQITVNKYSCTNFNKKTLIDNQSKITLKK